MSAVIPAYNYGRYVSQAVDSVLAQTQPNIECIVVDDGSTDDTRERLASYGRRIEYIHQPNSGLSAARNTGIRHARGEWIAFLDADDWWHPEKTAVQFEAVASLPDISYFGSPRYSSPLPARLPLEPAVTLLDVASFLSETPVSASSIVVRRQCFDQVGAFDVGLSNAGDRDMWLRLAARYRGARIDSPCWVYRIHEQQMNRNPQGMRIALAKIFKRFFAEHPEHSEHQALAWAFYHQDAGIGFLEAGARWTAAAHLIRSGLRHPAGFGFRSGPLKRSKLLLRALLGEQASRAFGAGKL